MANLIAVEEDLAKVLHFLERPANLLHLMLDMRGTAFERRVWEKLRAISVGRTVMYAELARWISPLASPPHGGARLRRKPDRARDSLPPRCRRRRRPLRLSLGRRAQA